MNIEKIHTGTGHQAALYVLSAGKDTRHFLSGGGDGWIAEWNIDDPENGKLAVSVASRVFSICTLPNPNLLVAGNMDGGVHWIDRAMPGNTRNIQHHQKGVYDIIAAGDWVFTAGGDGILSRWQMESGKSVESFQLSNRALRAIAYSQQRNELAVGSSDYSIYLLDAETLALKKTLKAAHTNSVFSVAWSPDGHYLLSGGRDAMLRVWDLEQNDHPVSEQAAHLFTINHIVFSPDGRFFATASRDKTLKIWEAGTFQLLKVIDTIRYGGHVNSVNRLLWLPDCLVSCSDDRTMMMWKIST
ncbi:MAG: WD40 repeat domain-containing protein [Saprospiraceae bacterium]|nr:WD40 repeat domain-containing protein [Saprospiraceae bacterium]